MSDSARPLRRARPSGERESPYAARLRLARQRLMAYS